MPVSTTRFKDYYGILGVPKSATEEEIKAAYKALALRLHPDRHPEGKEEASRNFIEVNDAYRFLCDKGRREWYDNFPATGQTKRHSTGQSSKRRQSSPDGGRKKASQSVPPKDSSSSSPKNEVPPSATNPPPASSGKPKSETKAEHEGLKEESRKASPSVKPPHSRDPPKHDPKPEVHEPRDSPLRHGAPFATSTQPSKPGKAKSEADIREHPLGDDANAPHSHGIKISTTPNTPQSRASAKLPKEPKKEFLSVPSFDQRPRKRSSEPDVRSQPVGAQRVPSTPPPLNRTRSESGIPQDQLPADKGRSKSMGGKIEADLRNLFRRMTGSEKKSTEKEPSLKTKHASIYEDSDTDEPVDGVQLHTTTIATTGVPSEWIFPLPLTLEELYEGTSHRYKIIRHLLSGKKKNIMVEIDVAPGWRKGTKVRFPGAGNERQGKSPQDIVFVVDELPHQTFTRKGSSLIARVQIPLSEALTGEGHRVYFPGLHGKEVEVRIPPGVVKPGQETVILKAGMPIRRQGKVVGQGDMIVRWEIEFPDTLSLEEMELIRQTLEEDKS